MLRPMDSGLFRVLDALGETTLSRTDLVRRAGEPHSVLRAWAKKRPELFAKGAERFRLSPAGVDALKAERRNRTRGSGVSHADLEARLREVGVRRGAIKRELDQVYATPASVVKRARFLVGEGIERPLFLGDDDLASVALATLTTDPRPQLALGTHLPTCAPPPEVLEVDPDLVTLLGAEGVRVTAHDLREPLPAEHRGTHDAVFSDPPYAIEGFTLFVARAIEALRPDGRLYLAFGASRRAPDRALAKQRLLAEAGLVVREVRRDFCAYEGAESIGSRSDLWVLRVTPQTRAPAIPEGALYTRRAPQ